MAEKKKKSLFGTGVVIGAGLVSAIAGGLFLYGPQGKSNRKKVKAWTLKAKADVLAELEKMKDVSQDKYENAVDKVVKKYGRLKDVGETEALKLGRELKKHWKVVAEEVGGKKTKK